MARQPWTPELFGSGARPKPGSRNVAVGRYDLTDGVCSGWGTLRMGPNMGRGKGAYRLRIPVAALNPDPDGFTPIGSGVVGWARRGFPRHRTFSLHVCGLAGHADDRMAVMAPDGGGFVSHALPNPGGAVLNIHFVFAYETA